MIIEVCTYRVKPSRRTEFLRFFETQVPALHAHGIRVLGPLTDLENPNRFVWLRSFPSAEERDRRKRAFNDSRTEPERTAMAMLDSWDFAICETTPAYTHDELAR